jgi:hypothetical protein
MVLWRVSLVGTILAAGTLSGGGVDSSHWVHWHGPTLEAMENAFPARAAMYAASVYGDGSAGSEGRAGGSRLATMVTILQTHLTHLGGIQITPLASICGAIMLVQRFFGGGDGGILVALRFVQTTVTGSFMSDFPPR